MDEIQKKFMDFVNFEKKIWLITYKSLVLFVILFTSHMLRYRIMSWTGNSRKFSKYITIERH